MKTGRSVVDNDIEVGEHIYVDNIYKIVKSSNVTDQMCWNSIWIDIFLIIAALRDSNSF